MKNELIYKRLKNGLQIYFYPDKRKHSTVISLLVHYGGFTSDFTLEEEAYHMEDGMAHLLEHLVFEKNCFGNFTRLFGPMQMSTNAITSTYMTEFYVDTVENSLFALEHLLIGVSKRVFTEKDVMDTKPPIYEEIRMRNDEVGRNVYYTRNKNLFHHYSYVGGLGTEENVKNFSYHDVCLCYDTFYQPQNEVLFIAGNIEVEEMISKIEEIYESLSFKNTSFSCQKLKEPKSVVKKYEVVKMPVAKDYVDVCYKVDFSFYSKENRRMLSYYIGLFLILNFSFISPLYKELLDSKIVEMGLHRDFDFFEDYLVINVAGYVNQEEEFVKRVRRVFERDHNNNKEVFLNQLKLEKMEKLCSDSTPFGVSREFKLNLSYYDYPGFDSACEVQSLNYEDYLAFLNRLKFKHYTVTKVTNP